MSSQDNKILIKIGKHFEATASGNIAVALVFLIVLFFGAIGYSFT